jgi:hypothetical protein
MRDATFFPMISNFPSEEGIWIFASNVAARANIAPTRQHFFHFHLRILSSGTLACRIKKAQKGLFPTDNCFIPNAQIKSSAISDPAKITTSKDAVIQREDARTP